MFNKRMRELREEKGLYQKELADKLSISRASIAMYETGERLPNLDSLVNIADFFEVSLDYLLGRTDMRSSNGSTPEVLGQGFAGLSKQIKSFSEDEKEFIADHIQFAISQINKARDKHLKSK